MVDLDFSNKPLLMGVVNVTPDSFSDGGQYYDAEKAVAHAIKLVEEGVDILDIGGESTRPGATPVSIEEEQARVLPVIVGIRKAGITTPISIDTRNADTMEKVVSAGADIVNDVSALTHDSESLSMVSKLQVPVILMHMQGTPESMQSAPKYDDVVVEIIDYLKGRIEACKAAGIDQKKIMIDPGIGFGKTLENNLNILKNINKFEVLGCPVLLGASRKSFIEKICPNTPPEERLPGSLAVALTALDKYVHILRVHDMKETRQALAVSQAINS